ncbi:MAG TPA: hypothetical protein VF522_06625 [Ramlibacter sp.]|uniref:hypothetical protein n=1 Tax=Ramlibacter sp. TaxID=1917967 RepID=UPI002ED0FE19
MHTAICTFDNPADARKAVDRLLSSGYDRNDVHLEYRHADGTPMDSTEPERVKARGESGVLMHGEPSAPGQGTDNWDSLEREVAMDSSRLRRLGHFFGRLFGRDEGAETAAGTYSRAVERGHCVVMVDAHSEEEAERAQQMLHGMEARDLTRVHRAGQPPLRDVVAERQAMGTSPMEETFGTARGDMGESHDMDMRQQRDIPMEREVAAESERAIASQGWGEQRRLDVVEGNKPIASPDIPAAHEPTDKPR